MRCNFSLSEETSKKIDTLARFYGLERSGVVSAIVHCVYQEEEKCAEAKSYDKKRVSVTEAMTRLQHIFAGGAT